MNKEKLSIIEKWQRKSIPDYDYETIELLKRHLHKAWETQELLEYRIQKAIEYIEEHKVYNKGFEEYDICDLDIENILNILKGEE